MRRIPACVLIFILAGCSTQKSWVYAPNPYPANAGQKVAVVLPFEDQRDSINNNHILMCLIPLVPYGYVEDHRPELDPVHIASFGQTTSVMWTAFKPREDLAKGLAQELKASGHFKNAYFDYSGDDADFVFSGQIQSTDYHETLISYGLSIFMNLPSLLGLPAGTVDNDLAMHLECKDRNGKVLFERSYVADHYHRMFWVYDVPNHFNYPDMARQIYGRFVADLISSGACSGSGSSQ